MANPLFIKIEFPSADNKKSAVAGGKTGSTGKNQSSSDESSGNGATDKIVDKLKSLVSFSAVKSTADKIATNRISTVSLRTGATEYEQRLSMSYGIASSVVGAGGSIVLAGLAAGPGGAAVAAISVAVSGVQKIMDIVQKDRVLNMQQGLENISIGMNIVRAGTLGRRSQNQ